MWRERSAADTGSPLSAGSAASPDAGWWSIRGCSAVPAGPAGATSEDRVSPFCEFCLSRSGGLSSFGGNLIRLPIAVRRLQILLIVHSDRFDWGLLIFALRLFGGVNDGVIDWAKDRAEDVANEGANDVTNDGAKELAEEVKEDVGAVGKAPVFKWGPNFGSEKRGRMQKSGAQKWECTPRVHWGVRDWVNKPIRFIDFRSLQDVSLIDILFRWDVLFEIFSSRCAPLWKSIDSGEIRRELRAVPLISWLTILSFRSSSGLLLPGVFLLDVLLLPLLPRLWIVLNLACDLRVVSELARLLITEQSGW